MRWLTHKRLIRVACLAGIVLVIGGSGALAAGMVSQARDAAPRIEMRATGKVVVTNSRKGKAVLSAAGLAPGKQVSGTVKIGNKGSKAVTLRLQRGAIKQVAGPNGGRLGPLLRLSVFDVTKKKPKLLYKGYLVTMKQRQLGTVKSRKARSFRFVVDFPVTAARTPHMSARRPGRWTGRRGRARRLQQVAPALGAFPRSAPQPLSALFGTAGQRVFSHFCR